MRLRDHELFPATGEEKANPAELTGIKVSRVGPGGGKEMHPLMFGPEELANEFGIHERWGGGVYELIAYGTRGAHRGIIDRRTLPKLAGASKPFIETTESPPGSMASAAPIAMPRGASALEIIAAIGAMFVPVATALIQSSQATSQRMFEAEIARHARDSELAKEMRAAEAARQEQARRDMQQMTTTILEVTSRAQSSAAPASNVFKEGFELANGMWEKLAQSNAAPETSEGQETLNTIGQTIEMMGKAKELLDANPKGAIPVPTPPVPDVAPANNAAA